MTARPFTVAGLHAALLDLGATPDAVAENLTAGGHRGVPGSPGGDPVARYLAAAYPAGTVSVTGMYAEVQVDDLDVDGGFTAVHVSLPEPVRRFVARFDAHQYPQLVEAPVGATP